MSDDTRVLLTAEQAIAMLPDGETIHTFRSRPGILIGADWERAELIDAIRHAVGRELGGEQCRAFGHGLVVWTDESSPLFVETQQEAANG